MPILPVKLPETVEEHVAMGNLLKELRFDIFEYPELGLETVTSVLYKNYTETTVIRDARSDFQTGILSLMSWFWAELQKNFTDYDFRLYQRVPFKEGKKVPTGPIKLKDVYFDTKKYGIFKLEKIPFEEVTAW